MTPGRAAMAAVPLTVAAAASARAAEEAAGEAGMPQFDSSTFSTQIFWLVVTFAVLYLMLWRVALPRVAVVLEERQERIADDLDKAGALKTEAEEVLAEYEKQAAEGRARAQATLRQAHDAMVAEAARQHAEMNEKLGAQIKAAEAGIATARQEATDNVRAIAGEIAQAATLRLIGTPIAEAAAADAVRRAAED